MCTHTPSNLDLEQNAIRHLSSHRRVASWQSDETLASADASESGDALLQHKCEGSLGSVTTVDYEFDDDDDSYMLRPRRRRWIIFLILGSGTIIILLLALDIMLRVSRAQLPEDNQDEEDPALFMWGKNGTGTDGMAWYPTNFLQDVVPKPIHSHNDYWRKVPLFTALRQGCIGVEADVWLFDDAARSDTLLVGHVEAALQPNRTFQSLYIDPLVKILEHQNPDTWFFQGHPNGVFDTAPNQTLALLVDVKTAGTATWAKVVEQLEPLRSRDWLTHVDAAGTVHTRPVTVVGTGNTPFADVVANTTYRDYFFDAPLSRLEKTADTYDGTNSYYASVSFGSTIGSPWMGGLGAEQVERIRAQVRAAHDRGLKVRYWDLPSWPVSTRNRIWTLLVDEGVDILNADDVKSAAKRAWRS